MTTRVFFFNKLRNGVDGADYEQWVRDVDYPTARSIPSIMSYEVVRLDGSLLEDGAVPYDYVEVIEVTDLDAYRADLPNIPDREGFVAQLQSYIGEVERVHGTLIE